MTSRCERTRQCEHNTCMKIRECMEKRLEIVKQHLIFEAEYIYVSWKYYILICHERLQSLRKRCQTPDQDIEPWEALIDDYYC